MINKIRASLSAKVLLSLLLALVCALGVFFAVSGVGRYTVEKIYMSKESVSARKAEIYSAFSAYVNANQITGRDTAAVARWTAERDYVTILVYSDQTANYTAGSGKNSPPPPEENSVSQYSGQYGKLYPLRFADGLYQIAISDNSQNREYAVNNILAVSLASVSFVAVMLWYVRRVTMRIISLSREAAEVGAGDLEKPITARGEDEIAMLAGEMDHMRRSVIERMGNEKRAWEANSELITAISHDIRTPMTSLIGYLGLLKESPLPDERSRQFAVSAYDKAMDLKGLTDELFKYFLVFGRSDLELNMERFDAGVLLAQLVGEAEFDLRDSGFEVRRIDLQGECAVEADPMYLKRVMDNLISNVRKYADKSRPVMLLCENTGGSVSICMSNYIAPRENRVESTKIGLRTCEKIMEHMGGRFVTRSDELHFAAELSLPVK